MLARVVVRKLLGTHVAQCTYSSCNTQSIVGAVHVIALTSKSQSSQLATGKYNTQSQVTGESGSEAKMSGLNFLAAIMFPIGKNYLRSAIKFIPDLLRQLPEALLYYMDKASYLAFLQDI